MLKKKKNFLDVMFGAACSDMDIAPENLIQPTNQPQGSVFLKIKQ